MAAPITLEQVRIASPCSARWEDMRGDDRVRCCDHCRLNVYNLSAMERDEAEALVAAAEGRLCTRMYRRADGTVLTRDCPVGLAAWRRRTAVTVSKLAAAAAVVLGAGVALASGKAASRARLRDVDPFVTVKAWLRPAPTAPAPKWTPIPNGRYLMGALDCVPPPVPTPRVTR
jgi:hypothetical protein